MNGFPFLNGHGMSLWDEDVNAIKESWRLLLARGAKKIYPAHGKPFKAEALKKLL